MGTRRREMGLGGYPDVTLAKAREAAREARDLIRRGIDPIDEGKATRDAFRTPPTKAMTFVAAAEGYMAAHEASWKNPKHRAQWTATLETYAYPVVADLSVAEVELTHVLKILEPIWTTKTETANRVRGRVEMILDWAAARDLRTGPNPARWRGHLDKLLAKPSKVAKVTHHKALSINDVSRFMDRLRKAEGIGARALEFAILTAARTGEVRGAAWSEVDLSAALWVIGADRMKAGREHRVPLSRATIELLKRVPRMAGTDLIFPAATGGQISNMTISAVLRRMGLDVVPHGFRSTFRDWVAERTAYPNEMAEMALAHVVGNKVEAAYRRGDMVSKRLAMMEDWAGFCGGASQADGGAARKQARLPGTVRARSDAAVA